MCPSEIASRYKLRQIPVQMMHHASLLQTMHDAEDILKLLLIKEFRAHKTLQHKYFRASF